MHRRKTYYTVFIKDKKDLSYNREFPDLESEDYEKVKREADKIILKNHTNYVAIMENMFVTTQKNSRYYKDTCGALNAHIVHINSEMYIIRPFDRDVRIADGPNTSPEAPQVLYIGQEVVVTSQDKQPYKQFVGGWKTNPLGEVTEIEFINSAYSTKFAYNIHGQKVSLFDGPMNPAVSYWVDLNEVFEILK